MSAVDWFQAAAAWIAVLVLAILNGALREKGRLKRKPWRDLVVPYTFGTAISGLSCSS